MTTTIKRTPEQVRDDRNARRRAKRLADRRYRMARHAAFDLVSWGPWTDDIPDATPAEVARHATGLYCGYLKGDDITPTEGETALRYVLQVKGLPATHLD
ncbi:hypothetical protein [Streptomyces olivaceus]|uniref:hypothetical protein n=1 Tax=Streptomyces olivaceus TaxID=47716 RepID=UPI0004C7E67F|nr:hypothetical protein [Streptomyces olivaceus]MBZ6107325.1 hypothetical protein [Streptomyces olivaceus]